MFDASVALVNYVREKSGRHDLDGSGLMTAGFSKNKPTLALNDLKDSGFARNGAGVYRPHQSFGEALRSSQARDAVRVRVSD